MRIYRVGILGFGMIGKVHAYGYRTLPLCYDPVPLEARITHVVTGRAETAEKARRTLGPDAASPITARSRKTPTSTSSTSARRTTSTRTPCSRPCAQKHIYCDKPLVATPAEAEEVRAALRDYRGVAQMTFQNRFYPATMRAKQLVDAGALGRVLEFRACYLHGGNVDPDAPMRWRLSAAAGGGVIADLGLHVLDLIDWLIGPFRAVMAETRIAYPERPIARDAAQRVKVDAEDSVTALGANAIRGVGDDRGHKAGHRQRGRVAAGDPRQPRGGAVQRHDAALAGELRRGRRGRAAGRSRGWTRIDCGHATRRRPPVFPARRPRSAGFAPTWPVWKTSWRRLPRTGPPCRGWIKASVSSI